MAHGLKNLRHIVGLGCKFKIDNMSWQNPLKIDALHGEDDDVVDCKGAHELFQKLPDECRGQFMTLSRLGHKPSPKMLDQAAEWVSDTLSCC